MTNRKKDLSYPYQGRNFLELPENYFYAECSDKNYLSKYLEYRKSVISSIRSISYPDPADYPFIPSPKTDLYDLLDKSEKMFMKGKTSWLDIFCAKFETRKKFYKTYSRKDLTPRKGDGDADSYSYIKFSKCLCSAYQKTGSFKYLSTLMKVNDVLCTLPFSYPDTEELLMVLEAELRFVSDVE